MAQLEQLLLWIGRNIGQLLTIVGIIQGNTSQAAKENVPFEIATNVAIIESLITDPTYGLITLGNRVAQILTYATELWDGTQAVALPDPPPTGYGAGDGTGTADAVWNWEGMPDNLAPWLYMLNAGAFAYQATNIGIPSPATFYFEHAITADGGLYNAPGSYAVFDPSDIHGDETLKTCLQRQNPTATCDWSEATDGRVTVITTDGVGFDTWTTNIDESGFQSLKDLLYPPGAASTPPVWPGIDSVTLLDPADITSLLTYTADMAGVIVNISSVGANKPQVPYGDQQAWRYIGAISFVSDNGDVEPWQQLAFANALYLPRTMLEASAVVLRTDASVAGTVTPFTIP